MHGMIVESGMWYFVDILFDYLQCLPTIFFLLSSFLLSLISFPYIIYNKVKAVLCIDINQERIKNA